MLLLIATPGGLLLMMGHQTRSESLFYYPSVGRSRVLLFGTLGSFCDSLMVVTKNLIRILWVADWLVLLAAVLPNLSGHPYPKPVRPYLEYGLLLLYLAGGACILTIAARARKVPPSSRRGKG